MQLQKEVISIPPEQLGYEKSVRPQGEKYLKSRQQPRNDSDDSSMAKKLNKDKGKFGAESW